MEEITFAKHLADFLTLPKFQNIWSECNCHNQTVRIPNPVLTSHRANGERTETSLDFTAAKFLMVYRLRIT